MARERPAAAAATAEAGPLGAAYLEVASRTELAKRLRDVWEHLTKLSQVRVCAGLCAWVCVVCWWLPSLVCRFD